MTSPLATWITAYRKAWESNSRDDISALFTEDARYFTEPFTPPTEGREAIIAQWLDRADGPGTTTFTWTPVVVTDGLAVVQGETEYSDVNYSNLWIIQLAADGRATEFTEWWMDQSKPS